MFDDIVDNFLNIAKQERFDAGFLWFLLLYTAFNENSLLPTNYSTAFMNIDWSKKHLQIPNISFLKEWRPGNS